MKLTEKELTKMLHELGYINDISKIKAQLYVIIKTITLCGVEKGE